MQMQANNKSAKQIKDHYMYNISSYKAKISFYIYINKR